MADGTDLIGIETERGRSCDKRAHAAAPEAIDDETGFGERGDDADVREAAGAAAREDEPERAARDTPGDSADTDLIAGLVDDVVRRGRHGVEPLHGSTGRHRREEDEVGDAVLGERLRFGVGEQEQAVTVAAHEPVPVRIAPAVVAHQDHALRCRLGARQSGSPVVRGFRTRERCNGAVGGELSGEGASEARDIDGPG